MPVVFVLFKGLSKKFFQIPSLRYLRSKAKSSTQKRPPLAKLAVEHEEIKIPRPVMTGLRSFIQGGSRNNPVRSNTTPVASYTDIESLSDEYHAQLHSPTLKQNRTAFAL